MMHLLFVWKKLSIVTYHLFEGSSMVNLKTTIDYNNILIKVLLNCIATVGDSETHSERPASIKDSKRYYNILYLHLANS